LQKISQVRLRVWGKAVTFPRYQSYDFLRQPTIFSEYIGLLVSGCAVERDRDCGPFLGSTQEACAVHQERSDSVAPRLQIAGERFDTDVAAGL
jgi:hypothetical protein